MEWGSDSSLGWQLGGRDGGLLCGTWELGGEGGETVFDVTINNTLVVC